MKSCCCALAGSYACLYCANRPCVPSVTYSHIPIDYDLLAKRVAEELIKLEKNDECKKSNNDQDK